MRITPSLLALIAAVALAAPAAAQVGKPLSDGDKQAVERCVGYMLMGPQFNGIKIGGQGFNCKPVGGITVVAGAYRISGQLSHQLTARPDDQINYTIIFTAAGELKDVRVAIDRGGFGSLPGRFFSTVGPGRLLPDFLRNPTRAVIDRIYGGLGGDISNWQRAADLVIGTLAVEVARSQANRDAPGSTVYFLDRPGSDLRQVELSRDRLSRPFLSYRPPANQTLRGELANMVGMCRAVCDSDRACKAWTIARSRAGRPTICYIKGDRTQAALNRDTLSALK